MEGNKEEIACTIGRLDMSFWSSPCAACKFLRRKCTQSCVLAPYFPPHEPYKFLCVHRVFGASNTTKILNDISPEQREAAVSALVYEADARIKNPVYGCVGYISLLQQQLVRLRMHVDEARKKVATLIGPAPFDPFLFSAPAPSQFHHPQFQGSAPFAEQQMMGLGLATGTTATPQPMIWNQSQSQMLVEARPMVGVAASDAAQEQQMFSSYDQQQQQELLRLGSTPFAEQQMMGLGPTTGAATPQPMIWNQSQSQMLVEARPIVEVAASDAAQEQHMFSSYDQQQDLLRLGSSPFAEQQMMGLGLATGTTATPQPLIWDQSQSQMLVEARPMVEVTASDAAQEQQMFSSYEQQQQQELLRLSSVHDACGIYNNVEVAASDAAQEQEKFGSYDQQQQQELLRLSNVEQLGAGVTVAIAGATESDGGLSLHPPSHHHQNLPSSSPSKEMR